jgi:hypothetical protein
MRGHFGHLHFKTFPMSKEHIHARCFDLCNRVLNFWESRRTPKSHFRECEWRPHTSLKVGLRHYLSPFLHSTLCEENLEGGGAPTFWLVEPPVANLAPTSSTSCSATSITIRAPTQTLCALHQSTWFPTQPFTPTRRVKCMCVIPGAVLNSS